MSAATRVLRWGILGTGNIAGKFASGIAALGPRAQLVAVGSREQAKADVFAKAHGAQRGHGSYEAVLEDPEVEVVYISLLNHLHARWAIACAEAGKHILCEKPATMTAAELEEVLAAVRAHHVFFMEAYAYRCHPRYDTLRRLLDDGAIGEVRMLHATFAFDGSSLGRPRLYLPEHGGGALMDVGVYPLSWLRRQAGQEPIAAKALGLKGASGVDEWGGGVLRFPSGVIGTFATAVRVSQPSVAQLYGERGAIEVVEPWRCPRNAPIIIRRAGAAAEEILAEDGLGLYEREALCVASHLDARQAPACTWEDSLAGMRLIDELRHQMGVWWPGEAQKG